MASGITRDSLFSLFLQRGASVSWALRSTRASLETLSLYIPMFYKNFRIKFD
jgi:hypothetical protein